LLLKLTDLEYGIPADFSDSRGGDREIHLGYGWLIEDNWLLKCSYQSMTLEDIGAGENNSQTWQGGIVSEHYFSDSGSTIIYLGVEAGWRRTKLGSVRESVFVLRPRLGIK
jgi:hypothetical protein